MAAAAAGLSAVPRPVSAGVTLTTCGQVLSTSELEYDYGRAARVGAVIRRSRLE